MRTSDLEMPTVRVKNGRITVSVSQNESQDTRDYEEHCELHHSEECDGVLHYNFCSFPLISEGSQAVTGCYATCPVYLAWCKVEPKCSSDGQQDKGEFMFTRT
jgi:hypothetical protein